MIELSYLNKLLNGGSVEWMPLGKIAEYSTTRIDAIELDATSFTGVDNLVSNKGGRIDANYLPNTARLTAYKRGDILLGNIRPYLKKVWMATDSGGCSGDVLAVRIRYEYRSFLSPIFLYYLLSSDAFFSYSMQHAKGAKMPRGSKVDILNYEIPIPCPNNPEKSLAIQSKIVRILDKFSALTVELTTKLATELAMRKKQYNYYRDQLLSFEKGEVEWKTLGDIGDVRMCKRILKNETQPEGDVPFYKIGTFGKKANAFISRDVFEAYKNKYSFPKKGDVLISASGTIGRTVIYDGEPAYFQDSNIVWLENDESIVTNKYLWHFYKIAKWAVSEGGTIDRLYNDNIRKTKIIVPYPSDSSKSLAEQNRVVAILDKFDALTSSISEGLPREIELRQKQYEYYRDLLLSFPKPEAASN
ncbi:restriction endonuclease subunit S [Salmonella enterica subsp. enterica serovar Lexington]|nr:restriction endonuclease subunit S [Salmonella enterica subsp. enterica serovar Lexington]